MVILLNGLTNIQGYPIINLEHSPSIPYICIGKRTAEGNGIVPFCFIGMATKTEIQQIEQWINQLLETETEYFCVSLHIKPTNNIELFLDGDNGLPIAKCVYFNRQLYKLIEESGMFPEGDFSLEVSSPGIEEPLKLHRQYIKNIGRDIEILFTDDSKKEGKLITVTETDLLLEYSEGKGKKAVTHQLVIPFSNIKSTTVQIKF